MSSESLYDRLHTTATAWLESYNHAHTTQNPTLLSLTLTPSCKRTFAPSSFLRLLPSLASGLSVAEFEKAEGANIANHDVYENRILDMTVDERQRKVALHTMRRTVDEGGREMGVEQMNILWMTEEGGLVRGIMQFCDVALAREVLEERRVNERDGT